MYYNTTNLTGIALSKEQVEERTQKDSVLIVFELMNKPLTPEDCKNQLEGITKKVWSINSIRRSITDLTKEGKLSKTSIFGMGDWNKIVHKWVIV